MNFSCLLSVYKKENPKFLEECLESIWDQQTIKPTQIVLVKDGELTYQLNAIIHAWRKRLGDIFLTICLPNNVGLGCALNIGLRACKYEFVARMDTDDIAILNRFQKQLSFLISHNDIAACSSVVEEIDQVGNFFSYRMLPLNNSELVKFAKRRCPLSHPAVMFRKSAIEAVGGYPEFRTGQDYALWCLLISSGYKIANLPDILVRMRIGDGEFKRRGWTAFKSDTKVYHYMFSIKFINLAEFIFLISTRFILSILPKALKSLSYQIARGV